MRPIDSNTLRSLSSSRTGDQLIVWAWYDGALSVEEPLRLAGWEMSWDENRTSQTIKIDVEDPTGTLAPWLLQDPLGVGGATLQVIYSVGGAGTINMGWYRITTSEPEEEWTAYLVPEAGTITPDSPIPPDSRLAMVSSGAAISVEGDDYALRAEAAALLAPESPKGGAPTVVGEITRLLQDICPVVVMPGVTDTAVNKSLVYDQQKGRWSASLDLAKRITAGLRMNGDGQAEIYPLTPQGSPIVLRGGPEGVLVKVNRAQTFDGLYNVFVADGTATVNGQQVPVRGVTQITAGPLAVGGPHGVVPKFYSSTMITTQAQADAMAAQMRDTQIASLTTDVKVRCLPMPHLQLGDWVQPYQPTQDGRVIAPQGRVVAMNLRSSGSSVDQMELIVRFLVSDVAAAFTGGSSLSIAGPFNRK